jgi:AAA+ ATPase superfamily predicted ATPase
MCGEKEKIIMAFYNEINNTEKEKIIKHTTECMECHNFYEILKKINSFPFENPLPAIDNMILSYSRKIISDSKFLIKRFIYSLSFAVFFVLIILPKENTYYRYETSIQLKISEIEKNLEGINYDLNNFYDFDFYE